MSLIATKMLELRAKNPELDRNMTRPAEYGALDFFISQSEAPNSIISAELKEKAFSSIGREVKVPVINYDEDVEVSHSTSCVIQDNENTSALYNVSWSTFSAGFTMVRAAHLNNEISYEQDFNRKLEKISRALANALDVASVAALEAQKTQVFKTKLNYTAPGNVVEVPVQMATESLGDIAVMMRANKYPNTLHIIGNAGITSVINKLAQHGIYNDVNRRMEFENKIIHYTDNVADEALHTGTMFAVEDGNVGLLTRVDRESLLRTRANGHEWDVVRLPYMDIPFASHYYQSVGDQSQIAGAATADLKCGVKEYFGFSADVAFIVGHNSNAGKIANPIIKAQIASRNPNQPFANPVYVTNAKEFQQA